MRVKARVAYLGVDFHGFAENPGVTSVAGEINKAITLVAGEPVSVTCAGRTDKGVHAVGQVVSFDIPDHISLERLALSVNSQCGPSVLFTDLEIVDKNFDARFSAVSRTYSYRILNGRDLDPFLSDRAWHISDELDVDSMQKASSYLIGEHDFSSFCKKPKLKSGDTVSLVRHVNSAEWNSISETDLFFEICASSFCHQMVRSIVGTLVDVGLGKIPCDDMPRIITLSDRQAAGRIAPPHGLTLLSVKY
ncbi:MAG: tRNA pseudouridine(38-40) synthase TruA [Actinomycetota bacterium]|nr:tRNA pseudouridine(38-40) synthase TruA [Actinomycetota bacterium]|tara:strand:+ start:11336 stop:12082 length:747 start_codon:yes stop_codon:yes gene_type:complete